jgi:hypothetical protein
MKNVIESEIQESSRIVVLYIPKVPLQGFSSVPAESVMALHCNVGLSLFLISLGQ